VELDSEKVLDSENGKIAMQEGQEPIDGIASVTGTLRATRSGY
jgi:hypothetical protein